MATNNDTKSSARLAAENLFGNFPKAPSQEESSTADTEYEEVGTARKARRGRKINGFAHAAYHEEAKMQPIPVKRAAGRPPKDKPYSAMIRVRVFQETAEACMARGGSAFIRGVLEMATGEPSEEVIAKNAPKSRRMSESAISAAGLRRIGPEGEILLKGPTITSGYYNRPELTKEAFTPDGYFRTGDAGYMEGGELFLKERIKDLFKTSNGKYIAPQAIEAKLLVDKYIDQIAIIADERKFVSALIIPEYRLVEEFARAHGIPFESREDLCANAKVQRMMMHRIDTLQQQLAHYEQVKRITLLPHHFSMERGELTNTLKLKRSVINENYKAEIDRMYEE